MKSKPSNTFNNNRDRLADKKFKAQFIAERRGWRTSLVLIGLAFICSLIFQNYFSPEKIELHIRKASQRIDSQLSLSFKNAELSLRQGWWLDFAVLVHEIELSSTRECWGRPEARIEALRLPLSFSKLLQGKVEMSHLDIKNLELILKTQPTECEQAQPAPESQGAAASASAPIKPLAEQFKQFKIESKPNPIQSVEIDKLRIVYTPMAFTSVELRNVVLDVPQSVPLKLKSRGTLIVSGATLNGDYGSTARFDVQVNEGVLQLQLKGGWKQGDYNMLLNFNDNSKAWNLNLQGAHLPLAQLFPLAKKYGFMNQNYGGVPAWMSFKVQGQGLSSRTGEVQFTNVQIDSDLGSLAISPATYLLSEQKLAQPVVVQLGETSLKDLLHFLNRREPWPWIKDLGNIQGEMEIMSSEKSKLSLSFSNLKIPVNHQGQETELVIAFAQLELSLVKGVWVGEIKNLKIKDGLHLGVIRLNASQDFKSFRIDHVIDELVLPPEVVATLTQEGVLSSVSGSMSLSQQDGKWSGVKVQLKADQLRSPFKELKDLNVSEDLKKVKIDLASADLQSFTWLLSADSAQARVKAQGGWDQMGQLSGELQVAEKRSLARYKIFGDRREPQFLPVQNK